MTGEQWEGSPADPLRSLRAHGWRQPTGPDYGALDLVVVEDAPVVAVEPVVRRRGIIDRVRHVIGGLICRHEHPTNP